MADFSNFIGIDIAKEKIDIFSTKTSVHKQIPNSKEAMQRFFAKFDASQTLIVLENTGGYENICLDTLIGCGLKIIRTNNNMVKAYIESFGIKSKTDKIDARLLAQYGKDRHESLKLYEKPSATQEKIRALVIYLAELKTERVKEKNRFQSPGCKVIEANIKKTIDMMDANIKSIEKQIDDLVKDDDDFSKKVSLLRKYKGVGKTTATKLLAVLPELGSIDRRTASALSGVAPYARDSGKKKGYRTTKGGGRPFVKSTLFMAALSAFRFNTGISKYFDRIHKANKAKRGGKMIAMVAVMRKMIIQLNAILRDGYIKT